MITILCCLKQHIRKAHLIHNFNKTLTTMQINKYVDISTLDKEAKKDYIDRHSAFVYAEGAAKKGEKYKVKVKVGDQYAHPDDADHFIAWAQLWDGEKMLAQASFTEGALGNAAGQLEVDFYIVPTKKTLKLTAQAFCTKHGLWQSEEKVVEVAE
jgi:superoxide reductase